MLIKSYNHEIIVSDLGMLVRTPMYPVKIKIPLSLDLNFFPSFHRIEFSSERVFVEHDAICQFFVNIEEALLGEGIFEVTVSVFEFKNVHFHPHPYFLFGHVIKDCVCFIHSKTIECDCMTKNLSF